MAYKALYRTYRPNSFEEVVGQRYIVTTLKNAIAQNKIAHAYLFCGPRGTGKTTVAKLLAKAINCLDRDNAPCNHCESCRMIQEGNHPDIVEIDAASNNGVDEIRSLIEKVKYAPLEGKYKVYIIDEVHMLTPGAFNALLKTLEEPPAHVIFVLATTEPQKVIATIISRCQRFDFAKVSAPEISKRLKEVLSVEEINCEDEVVDLISDLADGGMRDALSILDQCIAYAQDNLQISHVNDIYGITTKKEKFELLSCVLNRKPQELLDLTGKIIDNGMDIRRLTSDLIEILKECIIYGYTRQESDLLTVITCEDAESILDSKTTNEILEMVDILIDTTEKYRFATSVNTYFEVSLLKMMDLHCESAQPQSRDLLIQNNSDKDEPLVLQEAPQTETIDYERYLELLVDADKSKRIRIEDQWSTISNYANELQYARFASKLKDCSIKACGDGFVLVATESPSEADLINRESDEGLMGFMEVAFGERMDVFALTEEEFKHLVAMFVERQAANTLPAVRTKKKKEKKPTSIDKNETDRIAALFGEGMFDVVE